VFEDKPKTSEPPKTVVPDILPNQPILASQPQAWKGIIVEHHSQPPFEIPEHCLPQHLIAIQTGPPIGLLRRFLNDTDTSSFGTKALEVKSQSYLVL